MRFNYLTFVLKLYELTVDNYSLPTTLQGTSMSETSLGVWVRYKHMYG